MELVSQLYMFDFSPEIILIDELNVLCTSKLRSNYTYLVDSNQEINDATRKFMCYNAFIEYILLFLRIKDGEMYYEQNPMGTRESSICDCIPNTIEYTEFIDKINLESVFNLHMSSKPGNLFIYNFDNTLGVDELILLGKYKLEPDQNRPYSYSDGLKLYAPTGIEKLSAASKFNKPIILTKRYYGGTDDIREFLKKFNINAYVVPMLLYNGLRMSKPEVIEKIWDYIPEDIGLPEGVKIKTIDFADDLESNFEDINNIFANKNLKNISTHLVSLEDEFVKEYLMV